MLQPDIPKVFDRSLYLARQALASGAGLKLIDQRIAEELQDRLALINRNFDNCLLIAPRPEPIAMALRATGKCCSISNMAPAASDDLLLATQSFNAIFSFLDLHAINDVPGTVTQIANALKPDGLAMLAFFAGDSLRELRECWLSAEQELTGGASPRVAPMIDLRETGGLLQRAGLALPVADVDRMSLHYANALALMQEIKSLGYANCLQGRKKNFTSQRLLLKAAELYQHDFSNPDGRITATIEIAWATAWKPHPSQQKPLQPGSAKARLADALKVEKR